MPQTVTGLYVPTGGAPGSGYQASLTLNNPSAGANLVYTVGASFYEEVLNFVAFFQTDGNVGTRGVAVSVIDSNGVSVAALPSAGSQAQSDTWVYNFSAVLPTPTKDSVSQIIGGPVPQMILVSGWSIQMGVTGIKPGDQFTRAYITVNRIPTGVEQPPALELVPTPIAL